MAYLKIGDLAKRTETTAETLRYYEAEGLLPHPKRSDGGYRLYAAEDVRRVLFIRRSRSMGFTLKEVAELMSLQVEKQSSTCGDVKQLAELKLVAIDEKITELEQMKAALQQITDACQGGEASAVECTILSALETTTSH